MNYICVECNLIFDKFQQKANHMRWHHMDNTESNKNISSAMRISNDVRYGKVTTSIVKCHKCAVDICVTHRNTKKPLYYCSNKCAKSRGPRTAEWKKCVSAKIKEKWKQGHYDSTSALNHLKMPKIFSSKREREIVSHFKTKFPVDEWKSGGQLKTSNYSLSRDMYSDKLHICFEYDGDWHFININGQLELKKLKDLELEKWCADNNYRLIRIDERKKLEILDIENLIYNNNKLLQKIGDRY